LRYDSINPEDRKRIIREINCLIQLQSNNNVIDILDYSTEASYPWFVMPKADSNLYNYIISNGVFDEEKCLKVIYQILNAIEEAHDKDILHRDLGASNILLFTNDNLFDVKVADFSLGRDFSTSSKTLTRKSTSRLGQDAFVAPEQIRNLSLATKLSDIFAIGSLMSFMLTGEDPRLVDPTHSNLHFFISKCREKILQKDLRVSRN
jgi:eukaryotic-like serine/threonine-protein kinase